MPLPKHLLKQLPITSLPRPGERIVLPPLAGAADALALAGISSDGPMRVVMTASPGDAQRLLEEIRQILLDVVPDAVLEIDVAG